MEGTSASSRLESSPGSGRRPIGSRLSEVWLIREARRGSEDAAEAIVKRYWDGAERTAILIVRDRAGAEDIAQESLLRLLGSLTRFDERRRIGPWLNRIVVNRSIDWLRSREALGPGGTEDVVAEPTPEDISDPALLDALHSLSVPDRVAVVMRVVLDYRATEIAELLDEAAGTTRSRIHRSLGRLRAELEDLQKETTS